MEVTRRAARAVGLRGRPRRGGRLHDARGTICGALVSIQDSRTKP
ncbi:hypothetical protein BURMUCF1_A0060 [Burkholderia multivorans ATCC BAA-247]|nr:hypothetical protein BURMUCF1_A0060 [Burkholderia multivorans ATCC BAA-247]